MWYDPAKEVRYHETILYLQRCNGCDGSRRIQSIQRIKCLNQELNTKGYITVSGKVSSKYFEERVYGIESNNIK